MSKRHKKAKNNHKWVKKVLKWIVRAEVIIGAIDSIIQMVQHIN